MPVPTADPTKIWVPYPTCQAGARADFQLFVHRGWGHRPLGGWKGALERSPPNFPLSVCAAKIPATSNLQRSGKFLSNSMSRDVRERWKKENARAKLSERPFGL